MQPPISNLYVLEEDFYPDTWKDDGRMSVMLMNFRPRNVNQEHYDQKMRFWRVMIENYCEYKGSSQCSIQELKLAFKRNGVQPHCLQEVLNRMIDDGSVTNKDEFMKKPKSFAGCVLDWFVKPLSWGFGMIKEKLISNTVDEKSKFVVKWAVKRQAVAVINHIKALNVNNNLLSMDDLMARSIDGVAPVGVLLAIQQLLNEKKVYIEEANDSTEQNCRMLLKCAAHHDDVTPITAMERSVYNLEKTEQRLLQDIERQQKELERVVKQVKDYLGDGKKTTAKIFLRKKHSLETDLDNSIRSHHNVEAMLQRVQESRDEKELFNAMNYTESGLNLDDVYNIVEDIQERFDKQEEFDLALSQPIRRTKINDLDLEKELMEFMR